jgi:hypothetical protein
MKVLEEKVGIKPLFRVFPYHRLRFVERVTTKYVVMQKNRKRGRMGERTI